MIIRIKKSGNFTVMDNKTLLDTRLSVRALGLLAYMLHFPDDWQFSLRNLVENRKDGKQTINTAFKELVDNGYITKKGQKKDKEGRFSTFEYVVYDTPCTGFRCAEKRCAEKQVTNKNEGLLSTNINKSKGFEEPNIDLIPKEVKIDISFLMDKKFINLIKRWNRVGSPASKHAVKGSKTLVLAYKYCQQLISGTFIAENTNITDEWLQKVKYNRPEQKWTWEEIFEVVRLVSLQYEEGYYPYSVEDKKRILPKSLTTLFYNPYSAGNPSTFLRVFSKPPEYFSENIKERIDKFPKYTELFHKEFLKGVELNKKDTNLLIYKVSQLVQIQHDEASLDIVDGTLTKYYRDKIERGNFFSWFGRRDETSVFLKRYLQWLNELVGSWEEYDRSIRNIAISGKLWDRFCFWFQESSGNVPVYASSAYMQDLLFQYKNKNK